MADGDERRPLIQPPPGLLPPAKSRPEADVVVNTGSSTRRIRHDEVPVFLPASAGPARPEPAHTEAMGGTVVVWNLQLPDGSWHEVAEEGTVLGRDPAPPAHRSEAEQLRVADPARSMSKTHALFAVRDGRLTVEDLASTNGVSVATDAESSRIAPGDPVPVADGAVVVLGSLPVRVRRGRKLG